MYIFFTYLILRPLLSISSILTINSNYSLVIPLIFINISIRYAYFKVNVW